MIKRERSGLVEAWARRRPNRSWRRGDHSFKSLRVALGPKMRNKPSLKKEIAIGRKNSRFKIPWRFNCIAPDSTIDSGQLCVMSPRLLRAVDQCIVKGFLLRVYRSLDHDIAEIRNPRVTGRTIFPRMLT
jgi:hypothetical protein